MIAAEEIESKYTIIPDISTSDFELYVDNVVLTVNYYNEYLGAEILKIDSQNNISQFAIVKLFNKTILFKSKNNLNPSYKIKNSLDIELERKLLNFNSLYSDFKNKFWMYSTLNKSKNNLNEFAIIDCNGIVIRLVEY
jgi:hypothetical protein